MVTIYTRKRLDGCGKDSHKPGGFGRLINEVDYGEVAGHTEKEYTEVKVLTNKNTIGENGKTKMERFNFGNFGSRFEMDNGTEEYRYYRYLTEKFKNRFSEHIIFKS